jgi:hypothetical protein
MQSCDGNGGLALAFLLNTGQRRSERWERQHVRDGILEVQQIKTGARLMIPVHAALAASS